MPERAVLRLPHPVLKQRAASVPVIGAAERLLARDLVDTMRLSPACVGLAAPQICISLRVFCMDVTGHPNADSSHGEVVLFNPEVVLARAPETAREGCMSVPDLTGNVARASEVVAQGLDLDGRVRVIEANAFEARALLHEIDHLDGVLFIDRLDPVARDRIKRRIKKEGCPRTPATTPSRSNSLGGGLRPASPSEGASTAPSEPPPGSVAAAKPPLERSLRRRAAAGGREEGRGREEARFIARGPRSCRGARGRSG